MNAMEVIIAFLLGGVLYVIIELLYRGRSDVSMAFAGGFSFLLLHALFVRRPMPLLLKCIVGALIITSVEFIAGYIVNIRMKRNVWDYSNEKFNLYGQICLRFSCAWAALTVPAAGVSYILHMLFAGA